MYRALQRSDHYINQENKRPDKGKLAGSIEPGGGGSGGERCEYIVGGRGEVGTRTSISGPRRILVMGKERWREGKWRVQLQAVGSAEIHGDTIQPWIGEGDRDGCRGWELSLLGCEAGGSA